LAAAVKKSGVGRDIDDAAGALWHHQTSRPLGAHEGAFQIDRKHVVPFVIGDLEKWPSEPYAGVVDQDINAGELIVDGGEQPVHVGGRGDIRFNRQSLPADLARPLGYLASAIFIDIGEDEISARPT